MSKFVLAILALSFVHAAQAEIECSSADGRWQYSHYTNGEHGGPGKNPNLPDQVWSWQQNGGVIADQDKPGIYSFTWVGKKKTLETKSEQWRWETTYTQKVVIHRPERPERKSSALTIEQFMICREFREMRP